MFLNILRFFRLHTLFSLIATGNINIIPKIDSEEWRLWIGKDIDLSCSYSFWSMKYINIDIRIITYLFSFYLHPHSFCFEMLPKYWDRYTKHWKKCFAERSSNDIQLQEAKLIDCPDFSFISFDTCVKIVGIDSSGNPLSIKDCASLNATNRAFKGLHPDLNLA